MKKPSKTTLNAKSLNGSVRIGKSNPQSLKRFNSANKYKIESKNDEKSGISSTTFSSHGFEFVDNDFDKLDSQNATDSDLSVIKSTYNDNKWYSLNGRISRVQLLAYTMILSMGLVLIIATTFTLLESTFIRSSDISNQTLKLFLAFVTLPIFVIAIFAFIIYPRRRLHDVNKSGWWLATYFLPPISFILLYWLIIKKGNNSANNFGLLPRPNTGWQKALAWSFALFLAISLISGLMLSNDIKQMLTNWVGVPIKKLSISRQGLESYNQQEDIIISEGIQDTALIDSTAISEGTSEARDHNSTNDLKSGQTDMTNGPVLNTDPEAAPEVQEAINDAIASDFITQSNEEKSTNDYYEFLRASETPLLIEKEPLKTLKDTLEDIEDVHVDESSNEALSSSDP